MVALSTGQGDAKVREKRWDSFIPNIWMMQFSVIYMLKEMDKDCVCTNWLEDQRFVEESKQMIMGVGKES